MDSNQNRPKGSRIIKWSLVLGIVVVLNLFFNYTLSLIFNAPEYETFCKMEQVRPAINDQKSCLDTGGQWTEYPTYTTQSKPIDFGAYKELVPKGYCDTEFTCHKNFDTASKAYDKKVFVSLVTLGVLIIVAGAFIKGFEVLSLALSIGGVLSFVIASMRFWGTADEWIKVAILALALTGLIILAIKKFKD